MVQHRPADFSNFIGQQHVCRQLKVAINAAQQRGKPLDHTLFSGPAGLGKTTLCNIIVNAMGGKLFVTNGGVLKTPKDVIGSLVRLRAGDLLFIDEIHRIPMTVEEYLYTAMEDFAIDTIATNGSAVRMNLQEFTLLGATTREGMLSEPLLHRFGIVCRLLTYTVTDLFNIVQRFAAKSKLGISHNAAVYIAERARGTPRIALRLLRRVLDYAPDGEVDLEVAKTGLSSIGVLDLGLTQKDVAVLRALSESERAMGLATLCLMAHEEKDTIENVLEPHLMRCGLMERTPRGRIITKRGLQYLERIDEA